MTYDPATYWPERFRKQGFSYVARGGKADSYVLQQEAIGRWLTDAVAGIYVFHFLDFGCGVGRFAGIMATHARGYTGVDLVDGAMALNPFPTSSELPNQYDGVAAIQVFQHIHDDDVIRMVGDRLQPGGHAFIVDQTPEPNPGPHMHYRTPLEVSELLRCDILERNQAEVLGHWCRVMRRR